MPQNDLLEQKEKNTLSLTGYGHRALFDYCNCIPSFQKPVSKEAYDSEFTQIDLASFVGILIPISSIKKIGLPEASIFYTSWWCWV